MEKTQTKQITQYIIMFYNISEQIKIFSEFSLKNEEREREHKNEGKFLRELKNFLAKIKINKNKYNPIYVFIYFISFSFLFFILFIFIYFYLFWFCFFCIIFAEDKWEGL